MFAQEIQDSSGAVKRESMSKKKMDILIDGSGAGPDNSHFEILGFFRIGSSDADDYFCPQVHYKTYICLVCKWKCCMDFRRNRLPFLVGSSKRLYLVGRLVCLAQAWLMKNIGFLNSVQ